jgi:hypothetical protein
MAPDEGVEDVEGDPPVARKGGGVGVEAGQVAGLRDDQVPLGRRRRAGGRSAGRRDRPRREDCGQSEGGV